MTTIYTDAQIARFVALSDEIAALGDALVKARARRRRAVPVKRDDRCAWSGRNFPGLRPAEEKVIGFFDITEETAHIEEALAAANEAYYGAFTDADFADAATIERLDRMAAYRRAQAAA